MSTYRDAAYYERWKNQALKAYFEMKLEKESVEAELLRMADRYAALQTEHAERGKDCDVLSDAIANIRKELDVQTQTASRCQALADEYKRKLAGEQEARAAMEEIKKDAEAKLAEAVAGREIAASAQMRVLLEQMVYIFNTAKRKNDWATLSNMMLKAQKVLGK